ncbi:hypothetical protein [Microbacterium sp. YY-01]|uniref:hypothetical protein n=1 Tax=Microbacterium sp. YY-01 TaxID=3421634 RepID=UPI003D17D567
MWVVIVIAVLVVGFIAYAGYSSAKLKRDREEYHSSAAEAARRRAIRVPDDERENEAQRRADDRALKARAASPRGVSGYETKTLKFSQVDLVHGRTNVEKKLEPYIADGWEIVSKDIKKYNVGGKHTVLLRRARV